MSRELLRRSQQQRTSTLRLQSLSVWCSLHLCLSLNSNFLWRRSLLSAAYVALIAFDWLPCWDPSQVLLNSSNNIRTMHVKFLAQCHVLAKKNQLLLILKDPYYQQGPLFLKECLTPQQHQHKLGAREKGRTLGPAPGPHNQNMQHYVPSLHAGGEDRPQTVLVPSELLAGISTLGSPSLCTLPFPRQLILISHSFTCENSLPREFIPPSKSSVLASYFEFTFAVLQFSFLCLLADKRSTGLSSSEQKAVVEEMGSIPQQATPSPSQLLERGLVALGNLEITQQQPTRKGNWTVTKTANTQRVFLLQASPLSRESCCCHLTCHVICHVSSTDRWAVPGPRTHTGQEATCQVEASKCLSAFELLSVSPKP